MKGAGLALLIVGYPTAIFLIARWLPIVRQRRATWFAVHQVAVGCIIVGWLMRGRPQALWANGTWFVVAAVWYQRAGRRAQSSSADFNA
jgi:hypothetical protein